MKKKIIAVVAAILLLGVSSAAYAAPAANCLQYANAQKSALGIPNSLCGDAAGPCLVFSPNGCGSSAVRGLSNAFSRIPTLLDQASGCVNGSACNNAGNCANGSACDNASVCGSASDCANGGACNNASACGNAGDCANSGARNNANVSVSAGNYANESCTGGLKSAIDAIRQQVSGGNIVFDEVSSGANCNGSKVNATLRELLKRLIANGKCLSTPKPTATATPAGTEKPDATPVVTATPAATQKPVETPVITATPAATEKPDVTATPAATAKPTATVKPTLPSGADNLSYEEKVVELVNEQRALNGLSPLTLSSKLSDVARLKSQDMHDNKYFSHTSPTYGSPFDMMKAFGISYRTAGENIAKGYSSPEAVMNGWMNSPGHRANILNANYTTIGVGYVADGHYWTQEFTG